MCQCVCVRDCDGTCLNTLVSTISHLLLIYVVFMSNTIPQVHVNENGIFWFPCLIPARGAGEETHLFRRQQHGQYRQDARILDGILLRVCVWNAWNESQLGFRFAGFSLRSLHKRQVVRLKLHRFEEDVGVRAQSRTRMQAGQRGRLDRFDP